MTAKQQGALTTWLQTVVALAALYIPGLDDVAQLAILGVGASTLTLLSVFLPVKEEEADPIKAFEKARVRLAVETGMMMPSIDEHHGKAEGWPAPQDQGSRPPRRRPAADISKDPRP